MRPPILYLAIAFAAGLLPALNGVEMRVTAWCVLAGVALVYRRGDAVGRRGAARTRCLMCESLVQPGFVDPGLAARG